MQNSRNFNWEQLKWEDFQTLTLHFAQNLYPDTKFEEFLKKGNAQLGIDLKSFLRNDGSFIAIQCKKEKKLKLSDLKTIIKEFELKPFVNKTSEFIIATSADLQRPDLQSFLDDTALRFRNVLNIRLKYWDINFLDEQLKSFYSLVYFYFGKDATAKCFPAFTLPPRLINTSPKDHIPRRVFNFKINDSSTQAGPLLFAQKTFSLTDILQENRLLSKQICLIADAYQGKSHLIQQTAFDLESCEVPFRSMVVQVKDFPIQPIEHLMNRLFGEWRSIPPRDLILFFDGMDEVPTDQFDEAVRHINLFSLAYPSVSIVFSCRKLFYHRHRVQSTLETFNTYELYPLQFNDISNFLRQKLNADYEKFQQEVVQIGISHFLYHPFYLINLVDAFTKPPFKLPGSKVEVLERFVENSFNKQAGRRTSKGQLHQQIVKYKKAIQKFAFALQLSGLNSFTDAEVQTLFSDSEIELLQHNSLVTVNNNRWSFNNALFQEHLAAMVLFSLSYSDILPYVTVGRRHKKIKTKWIQTISSLFNILEPTDERTTALIKFMQKDNIELIFTAEKSKFSPEFRLTALKTLIQKCWKLQIRPMLVYENDIAAFVDHDASATKWLIDQLKNKKYSILNKTTILRIIRSFSSLEGNDKLLLEILSSGLAHTEEPYVARLIFTTLASHRLGDAQLISKSIKSPLAQFHDFRSGLYELIVALKLVDHFYFFALEGCPALIEHNKKISHAGSEISLETMLLSFSAPANCKLLLRAMQQDEWIAYYERHSIQGKEFFHSVLEKTREAYKTDNTIVLAIVDYIKAMGRKYLRDELFNELDTFLEQTNAHSVAVRLLINDIVNDKDWELGALIRENVFDYLLFEFDQHPLNLNNLRSCVSALRYKHRNETADKLTKLFIDYSEGSISNSSGDRTVLLLWQVKHSWLMLKSIV